jgi:hypothetical protein
MFLRRRSLATMLMLLLGITPFGLQGLQAADSTVTKAALESGLKEREAYFRRVSIAWRQQRVRELDTHNSPQNSEDPTDATTIDDREFILDAGRWRYSRSGPELIPSEGRVADGSTTVVWNGTTEKMYLAVGPTSKTGSIKASTRRLIDQGDLRAIALSFRPYTWLRESFGNNYKLLTTPGVIGDATCVVVERARANLRATVWFDVHRSFLPLRYTSESGGRPRTSVDIEYTRDVSGAWVPQSWNVMLAPGDLSSASVRLPVGVNNRSDNLFAYNFPVDTWVSDHRTGEEFIVRGNDEKRPVLESELMRGVTYNELLNSASGQAGFPVSNRVSVTSICLLGLLGAVVVLAIVLVVRRVS